VEVKVVWHQPLQFKIANFDHRVMLSLRYESVENIKSSLHLVPYLLKKLAIDRQMLCLQSFIFILLMPYPGVCNRNEGSRDNISVVSDTNVLGSQALYILHKHDLHAVIHQLQLIWNE
jgi:hypothetical protein